MRTKKLWKYCSSVLVVALSMNMCLFNTSASNTEGTGYLLSTPSNAQGHEDIEDEEVEIENNIVATPSDLTKPEKVVQYDPQPKSLEEVQELIDAYNASLAVEPKKPHWEFLVQEEFMPEGYYCALVEDDEEFGADYYTFFPVVAIRTMAINNGWDGTIATSFAGGSGTESDPYLISNGSELAYAAVALRNSYNNPSYSYCLITEDINLNQLEWTPLGQYKENLENNVTGSITIRLDGGGHNIYGLKIDSNLDYQGLFSRLNYKAHVKNLNLIDVEISGGSRVGGIAGKNECKIENCTVSGTIAGIDRVGGIVGEQGPTTFDVNTITSDSINYASVTGNNYVGGIAGNSYRVKNSVNYGEITGQNNVGGIGGTSETTTSCGNFGSIIGTGDNVGGIIGQVGSYGTLSRCYNHNSVTGASNVGGIVGYMGGQSIRSCYNVGEITGNTNVGGLFGYINTKTALYYCYNAGNILGNMPSGGLVGNVNSNITVSTISKCYYLDSTYSIGFGDGRTDVAAWSVPLKDFSMLHSNLGTEFEEDIYGVNQGFPVLVNGVYAQPNVSDSAKVFFNTDLSYGTTEIVREYLEGMGYTTSNLGNPATTTVLEAFGNSNVVHVLGHGGPGVLALVSGNLTANDISNKYSALSTKFVFLEGCNTSRNSAVNGDLDNVLYSLGVECVIAFDEVVTASTDDNGIHYFANMLYFDMYLNGSSVRQASVEAMRLLYESSGDYWGTQNMVISGNTNINLN